MKSSIVELAEYLGFEDSEVSSHGLAEQVCCRVLHNIHNAESAPINALHWSTGMTYLGIGNGQVEMEVGDIIDSGMASTDDLLRICDRMDDMLKVSEKLYAEMERFLMHKTFDSPYKNVTSITGNGIASMCSELQSTHHEFRGGCKTTTARIRMAIKRREKDQADPQQADTESTLPTQIGMEV